MANSVNRNVQKNRNSAGNDEKVINFKSKLTN